MSSLSNEQAALLRKVYAFILSVLLVALSLALAISCILIYTSGPRPFTRDIVGKYLTALVIPIILTVAAVLGGFILWLALPPEEKKIKAKVSSKVTLSRLHKKLCGTNASKTLLEAIAKEQRKRRFLLTVNTALYVFCSLSSVIYFLVPSNFNDFSADTANTSVIKGVLFAFINLALPLAMSLVLSFLFPKSYEKEISLVKDALSKKEEAPVTEEGASPASCPIGKVASFFQKNENKLTLWTKYGVLLLAAALFIAGIVMGGSSEVVQKAIKICTECIGLG